MQIPSDLNQEIKNFISLVKLNECLLDTKYLRKQYRHNVKKFISSPFDKTVTNIIIKHLKKKKAMSVIRLGDGEMNLLSLSQYENFPKISYYTADYCVRAQSHSFDVTIDGLFILEQMMISAVFEADIVGVLGHWRPKDEPIKAKGFFSKLQNNQNIRGMWGHWTGLDYIFKLHQNNVFKRKILTSAHLYFSILQNLGTILKYVSDIYLITDQYNVLELLKKKYPNNNFHLIREPATSRPLKNKEATFLRNIMHQLPTDMKGTLTLIGAGIWSELYCTWVKRRRGVAVDIGSGFDLLVNKPNRRIHHNVEFKI